MQPPGRGRTPGTLAGGRGGPPTCWEAARPLTMCQGSEKSEHGDSLSGLSCQVSGRRALRPALGAGSRARGTGSLCPQPGRTCGAQLHPPLTSEVGGTQGSPVGGPGCSASASRYRKQVAGRRARVVRLPACPFRAVMRNLQPRASSPRPAIWNVLGCAGRDAPKAQPQPCTTGPALGHVHGLLAARWAFL